MPSSPGDPLDADSIAVEHPEALGGKAHPVGRRNAGLWFPGRSATTEAEDDV